MLILKTKTSILSEMSMLPYPMEGIATVTSNKRHYNRSAGKAFRLLDTESLIMTYCHSDIRIAKNMEIHVYNSQIPVEMLNSTGHISSLPTYNFESITGKDTHLIKLF